MKYKQSTTNENVTQAAGLTFQSYAVTLHNTRRNSYQRFAWFVYIKTFKNQHE